MSDNKPPAETTRVIIQSPEIGLKPTARNIKWQELPIPKPGEFVSVIAIINPTSKRVVTLRFDLKGEEMSLTWARHQTEATPPKWEDLREKFAFQIVGAE